MLVIRQVPDPVLREVCTPVETLDEGLAPLVEGMFAAMYAAPGRGLAGPQVGVTKRLFVTDATWKEGERTPKVWINPRVLWTSDESVEMEEACLSIPDTPCLVTRPVAIRLGWQGLDGTAQEAEFDGVEARILQHEYDHLDGVLCTDRAA